MYMIKKILLCLFLFFLCLSGFSIADVPENTAYYTRDNLIISLTDDEIPNDESKPVEMLAGVEYVADCWALRLVGQRTLDSEDRYDTTFFIQLELTGLGSIGSDPIEELRRAIPGYRPTTDQPGAAGLYDYYE